MSRLAGLLLLFVTCLSAELPTPESFAGFRMGADRKLLRWDRIVEYLNLAQRESKRVRVRELGKTTNGNPFLLVTISAPQTIGELPKHQAIQRRIAYPGALSQSEAESILATQKAVLLITCNIHSTEIGSSQMVLELVHRLATEDSPFVRNILDNVIFLLVPSFNPDGQIIVTDWYNRNLGSPYERSPLPELYHKYAGHDNNRDAFMNTQVESRYVNKLCYKDWFPHVFLDEHQMGSSGARIFVPPFKDPINPNVDPAIWQLNGMLGYAMGAALHDKGYTGIINDAMYTSWWQGGFVMQAWWHNMVGLLTEVASVAIASPIEQRTARLNQPPTPPSPNSGNSFDPRLPLPPPTDTTPRNTYPRPWLGGQWTLRDIVDYELAATYGLLEAVANNRRLLTRTFFRLNQRQIELGEKEAPFAYVVPAAQHDRAAASRLLEILDEQGVVVHVASQPFEAEGRKYEAGTHVIRMAQPFRAFAKDLLEKQTYVAQRTTPGGPVERPYDVTGWTLPLQMGVETIEVKSRFSAVLQPATTFRQPGAFLERDGAVAWEIAKESNNAFLVVNRLLKAGARVAWTPGGSIVARTAPATLRSLATPLSVDVKALQTLPAATRRLRMPRVALYRSHQPVMDEGWTRWLLEQYEFAFTNIRPEQVKAGGLREKFDVILFPDQTKDSIVRDQTSEWIRPEHRGGIGNMGIAALKDFVRDGGTIVALGHSSLVPIEEFPLPLKNALRGLRPDQFSCPGSILRVFVDPTTQVGNGMKEEASAVFYNDLAFEPAAPLGDASVKVVARYPSSNLLQSGWIAGEQFLHDRIAAADVSYGKGRVILLGFSVQNRAQPHGTFKLLFNALHAATAE